jgi:hypothetical protein
MRIVVADDLEKLANRLEGTLKIMREIAKIAGRRGRGARRPRACRCQHNIV